MTWEAAATRIHWNIQPFINGRYRLSEASDVVDNVNPATETILCTYSVGDSADVDNAVRVARQRFDDGCWSELAPARRANVLWTLADLVVKNKAELALRDCLEVGKPIQAALNEAEVLTAELLRSIAGFADKLLGKSAPLSLNGMAFNTYEPRGVVGAITPWNFPSANAVLKFAPALAAGNSVVLKPSELSPSTALKLAELALEAGVPEGVLNVVPGLGVTAGAALALHPDVNLVSFTGSSVTGRKLMELSGRSNGKPLLLECGGKSPHVVFDDVGDLDRVADAATLALLWNQGQVCSAHTRLIVQDNIAKTLVDKIAERAGKCRWGNPLHQNTTFGPLASSAQRERVKHYITQGLEAGAIAVLHGKVQDSGGCYVSPTIFDHVDASMSIAREEVFGPLLCVQHFKSEQEATVLANGTDYGLATTVWTKDMGRGKRLAHAMRAGVVSIRTSGKEDPDSGCVLSHEPQKASGFGSERGLRGLQSYSTLKVVSFSGA
jgi:acyl-CoA reductase-like NAD-dependent aldehyde dehydrogenase